MITCLVLKPSPLLLICCVAKLFHLCVRTVECGSPKTHFQHFSFTINLHRITRHVFAPVSTLLVLEWNGGSTWKEGRFQITV